LDFICAEFPKRVTLRRRNKTACLISFRDTPNKGEEKVSLIEALTDEERKTIYTMLDAFIGKKKLKDALANVLHDVK
jgi:hypothetical protein